MTNQSQDKNLPIIWPPLRPLNAFTIFLIILLITLVAVSSFFISYKGLSFDEMKNTKYSQFEGEYISSNGYYYYSAGGDSGTIVSVFAYDEQKDAYVMLHNSGESRCIYHDILAVDSFYCSVDIENHNDNLICTINAQNGDGVIRVYDDAENWEGLILITDDGITEKITDLNQKSYPAANKTFFNVYSDIEEEFNIYVEKNGEIIWQISSKDLTNLN